MKQNKHGRAWLLWAAIVGVWAGQPALAAAPPTNAELAQLVRTQAAQIKRLKRRLEAVENRQPASQARAHGAARQARHRPSQSSPTPRNNPPAPAGSRPLFGNKGGLKYISADGDFTFQVGGRVQTDGTFYDQDKASLGNGAEARRVRLFAKGLLYHDWGFKAQFDFANSGNAVRDAYLQYLGAAPLTITAGNFKEPFSLSNRTSSKYTTFTERALAVDAFRPGRRIGLAFAGHGRRWHAALGGFGNRITADTPAGGDEQDMGWSVAARATAAPIYGKNRLLHVGASVEYRNPGDDETLRFRDRPESHQTAVRLVDTGAVARVNDYQVFGVESAVAAGPFSVQGEYLFTQVNRDGADAGLDGGYVYGSWFLTGESRAAKYKPTAGKFGRLKPRHPWGAVEVALRYSTLDLNADPIDGGAQDDITFGLNWYVNRYVRLSGDYVDVVDVDGGPHAADEPQSVQLRAQVEF